MTRPGRPVVHRRHSAPNRIQILWGDRCKRALDADNALRRSRLIHAIGPLTHAPTRAALHNRAQGGQRSASSLAIAPPGEEISRSRSLCGLSSWQARVRSVLLESLDFLSTMRCAGQDPESGVVLPTACARALFA